MIFLFRGSHFSPKVLGRLLAPQKVGRKPKAAAAEEPFSPFLPGRLGET